MVVTTEIIIRSLITGLLVGAGSIAVMFIFPDASPTRFDIRMMILFFIIGFVVALVNMGHYEAQRRKHEHGHYNPQSDHNKSSHKH